MKKVWLIVIWLGVTVLMAYLALSKVPYVLIKNNPVLQLTFLMRVVGLVTFTILFWQIVIGALLGNLSKIYGGGVYLFHRVEGVVIYLLTGFHTVIFLYINYLSKHKIDPFYIYTDVCALCNNKTELYYSFGRYAFWILSIIVVTALFAKRDVWLKKNWLTIHALNYAVFEFLALHFWFIGYFVRQKPVIYLFLGMTAIITYLGLFRLTTRFVRWLR